MRIADGDMTTVCRVRPGPVRNDTRKKRFIDGSTFHGPVYQAAQAAEGSRQTACRWRENDLQLLSFGVKRSRTQLTPLKRNLQRDAQVNDFLS